jgi:hypothetical protein
MSEEALVSEFSSAISEIHADLVVAFHDSLTAAQAAVQSNLELRHVDAVFETALPLFQQHLSIVERIGWKVGIGGAFVHGGNRYEARSAVGNCEIADLLVVVEVSRPPETARTAVLLQAKKPMSWPAIPWAGPSGERQLAFYEQRPEFTWRPSWVARYYRGRERTLKCDRHRWGHHQLLSDQAWADPRAVFAVLLHPRPWTVPPQDPEDSLPPPVLLAALLADLVRFRAGHPFERLPVSYADPDHLQWSAVIWDILQSSFNRSHYRETVPDRDTRWTLEDEGAAGEGYAALDDEFGVPGGTEGVRDADDFTGGVSVVRFVFTGHDDFTDDSSQTREQSASITRQRQTELRKRPRIRIRPDDG